MTAAVETFFVATYVIYTLACSWSFIHLRRFLSDVPSIKNASSLERYKDVVRHQMYLALGAIAAVIAAVGFSVAITSRHGALGFGAALAANLWFAGLGMVQRRLERKAQNLPTETDSLEHEYRTVSENWRKKPFPDF